MVRLGHGEGELQESTSESWSKYGRVNYFLEQRVALLAQVSSLAKSFGVLGDHGGSFETAGYFYTVHIKPRCQAFLLWLNPTRSHWKSLKSSRTISCNKTDTPTMTDLSILYKTVGMLRNMMLLNDLAIHTVESSNGQVTRAK
jgi:hypothetical protein